MTGRYSASPEATPTEDMGANCSAASVSSQVISTSSPASFRSAVTVTVASGGTGNRK